MYPNTTSQKGKFPRKELNFIISSRQIHAVARRRRADSLEGIETMKFQEHAQQHGAAEGQIPWKGLKHPGSQHPSHEDQAAEGQIPWKGLKPVALSISACVSLP